MGGGFEDLVEFGGVVGWGEGIYIGELGKWGLIRDGFVY